MKESSKIFKTGDVWLASAIAILLNTYPKFTTENNKTIFLFPAGDDTYQAIAGFNSGISMNVFDYAQMVKRLKVEMFARREENKNDT